MLLQPNGSSLDTRRGSLRLGQRILEEPNLHLTVRSVKVCTNFGPWDRSDMARAVLGHPALDLSSPCVFGPFVGLVFNALEQHSRKFRPVCGSQLGRSLVQLFDSVFSWCS
jgi:hypothetical protein